VGGLDEFFHRVFVKSVHVCLIVESRRGRGIFHVCVPYPSICTLTQTFDNIVTFQLLVAFETSSTIQLHEKRSWKKAIFGPRLRQGTSKHWHGEILRTVCRLTLRKPKLTELDRRILCLSKADASPEIQDWLSKQAHLQRQRAIDLRRTSQVVRGHDVDEEGLENL
jgi:hypothetical protein